MDNIYYNTYGIIRRAATKERIQSYEQLDLQSTVVWLKAIEKLWNKFCREHESMMAKEEADIDELVYCMERAERRHGKVIAALLKRKDTLEQEMKSKNEQQPFQLNVIMPIQQGTLKNTWGKFDGNLLKWLDFKGRFMAAVHNNDQISPIFKFVYLKESLIEETALALCDWELTAENYSETWERLVQRYDKKYPLIQAHLKEFFQLPYLVGKPTAEALQNMANVSYRCLLQLKSLGVPTEHWDVIIVHALHERLYADTAREWMLYKTSEFPTWAEMLDFLEKQVTAIATANPCIDESIPIRRSLRNVSLICLVCDSDHHTFQCKELLSLSLNARIEYVLKRRVCFNCLKLGHSAARCSLKPCKLCSGLKHSSALCPVLENKIKRARAKAVERKAEFPKRVPSKRAKLLDVFDTSNYLLN